MRRNDDDVEIIKTAILQSQYDAARSVNEKQLKLYYGIGKYISMNSRKGFGVKVRLIPSANGWTKNFLPLTHGGHGHFGKEGLP